MNRKQIASSLFAFAIVLLVGMSISQQSVSANVDSTPTSVWPPPTQPTKTYHQMLQAYKEGWLEFEDEVSVFDFDFTCPIPCWSTFKLGMPFYELIDTWEAKMGWRPFVSEEGIKENSSFGIQGYTLSITALSDASSPDSLLRAYIIRIPIPIEPYNGILPPAEVYAALPETVRNFLPDAQLISTPPRSILVGTFKRYYLVTSVVYEHQSWAIQYFYRARPNQPNCFEHELYGLSIWVYSDAESGFQSLWQDIQQNYLLSAIIDLSVQSGKLPAIAFQTLDTQAFKAARQAGHCTPLDSQ
jgi:hypothetical protein